MTSTTSTVHGEAMVEVTGGVDTQRRMKALIVTAPESLRAQLRRLGDRQMVETCAGLRPDRNRTADPTVAAKIELRSLARRHQVLTEEINDLDELLTSLVAGINPDLLAVKGVGTDVAGQLLLTAGQNTDRLTDAAAFAMLCGAAPIPASSGKTTRHRLNRGGDRHANSALWRIVITRTGTDQRTKNYVARRTAEGLSKPEIIPLPQALRRPRSLRHTCATHRRKESCFSGLTNHRSIRAAATS